MVLCFAAGLVDRLQHAMSCASSKATQIIGSAQQPMMQNSTSGVVNFATVHVAVSSPKPQLDQACHCNTAGGVNHLHPCNYPRDLDHAANFMLILKTHVSAQS